MRLISLSILLIVVVACKKKTTTINTDLSELNHGLLVLNEGLFNLNNASLSWVDLNTSSVSDDFFQQKTGRKLGDTGNDIQRYGNKIYIVVNVSSTLEILNASTGQSVKQIVMQENDKAKQPRNLAFHGGKVFISCFDGYIDVLDTTTMNIEKRIKVGDNPENMLVVKDRLFVSNSGGLNPNLDSTLSIVDCQTLTELSKITVGKNPGKIVAKNDTTLFVHVRGNYASIPAKLIKLNVGLSKTQETILNKIAGMEKMEDKLLVYTNESVVLLDMTSNLIINESFIKLTDITTLYRIQYIEELKQFFVFDANSYTNSGYLHRFSKDGQFIQKYHVGLNPNSLIYYE